ncbi:DNA repair protein RAD51-like protein 2 [Dichanthelium oligosanthes]|uniref:DNA repair protein RAD51-like protein 2 n=1 Tax=Dichanthelium oligosanthes TaxID=888268 RepID=A0A1E5V209_9POAL|nr:DNA repair protein RAD51-like protein 2 [Dichanthelium oligosanthes]
MANMPVSEMRLPPHLAHLLSARRLDTAKVSPSRPPPPPHFSPPKTPALTAEPAAAADLLNAGRAVATGGGAHGRPRRRPPDRPRRRRPRQRGRLPALPDGACDPGGARQFCLKLALLAALPEYYGGLDGRVVYIDTESKFSSRRMIEIGQKSFPQIFRQEGLAQKMAGRILVMRPTSLADFTKSLEQMKVTLLQHDVKLLIVDSMAALMSLENEKAAAGFRQHPLRWALSFLKSIAEFSRIPVVVTNQVRSQSNDDGYHFSFEVDRKDGNNCAERFDSHLIAALGIQWAHAVTVRLVFESHSGHRFIKVAKSPMSPAVAFPFVVESSGITLLSDEGIDVTGPEITSIRCQGQNILAR